MVRGEKWKENKNKRAASLCTTKAKVQTKRIAGVCECERGMNSTTDKCRETVKVIV